MRFGHLLVPSPQVTRYLLRCAVGNTLKFITMPTIDSCHYNAFLKWVLLQWALTVCMFLHVRVCGGRGRGWDKRGVQFLTLSGCVPSQWARVGVVDHLVVVRLHSTCHAGACVRGRGVGEGREAGGGSIEDELCIHSTVSGVSVFDGLCYTQCHTHACMQVQVLLSHWCGPTNIAQVSFLLSVGGVRTTLTIAEEFLLKVSTTNGKGLNLAAVSSWLISVFVFSIGGEGHFMISRPVCVLHAASHTWLQYRNGGVSREFRWHLAHETTVQCTV